MSESVKSIINDANSMLKTAYHGLDLLKSQNPTDIPTGVRNVLTFGREIPRILQRLKSHVNNFNEWYLPYKEEMENDPFMKYLYNLRNNILKEGKMPLSSSVHIHYFNDKIMQTLSRPPNAKIFFIGDQFGGTGWEIQLPDGSTEKFYIKLPMDVINASVYFENIPSQHLGKCIGKLSIEQACELYLKYLSSLIKNAKKTFF